RPRLLDRHLRQPRTLQVVPGAQAQGRQVSLIWSAARIAALQTCLAARQRLPLCRGKTLSIIHVTRGKMITMLGSPRRCCDGLTRRETLKAVALGLLAGCNLPALLHAEEARDAHARPGKAKSVILLYLLGGAATQDMIDLKPSAPKEVRGEFKPIATNVPG